MGKGEGKGAGGGNPIEHFVVLMLENRSFDHMLGFLKRFNPNIDGLNGNESNPYDPSNPSQGSVTVTDTAGYVTNVDPDHSIPGTTTQIFGNGPQVSNPPMNGFVYDYYIDGDKSDNGAQIMQCFQPQTTPTINTLASQFGLFDSWHASVPGPTEPNRMYVHSATSHGAGDNDDALLILGYPQRTIYQNISEAGHDWKCYFSDFPATLIMRQLREKQYWDCFKQMQYFYDDCQNGTLPTYSFLEPRWFHFLYWSPSDEHPPHNVTYGEYLIADVYEALRASPLWEKTALIVTYDEHGGFFDHVPTPTQGVPNPDGLDSDKPPFNFQRLGIRVPVVAATPWMPPNTVLHEPTSQGKPTQYSQFEHSSVPATLKKALNLPSFLTDRDAWACTFDDLLVTLPQPRTDCPTQLPRPGSKTAQMRWKNAERLPETSEMIETGEMEAAMRESSSSASSSSSSSSRASLADSSALYEEDSQPRAIVSNDPLTDLQYEMMQIANGLTGGKTDIYQFKTEHEGALFVRQQLHKFWGSNGQKWA